MADRRDFFERLVYETVGHRRFTQQSPVMPDVWIRFGMEPGSQQDLLMVPNWHYTPADLARGLKRRLATDAAGPDRGRFRGEPKGPPRGVAHNQNAVVARLWFDELVRAVLPLSEWWQGSIAGVTGQNDRDRLVEALADRDEAVSFLAGALERNEEAGWLTVDLLWLAQVAGVLAFVTSDEGRARLEAVGSEDEQVRELEALRGQHRRLAEFLIDVLMGIEPVYPGENYPLFTVNRNREASSSLNDSVAAVKADASHWVFQVGGAGIRWAVIDSGIDATHVAFRERDDKGVPKAEPFSSPPRRRRAATDGEDPSFLNNTRVVATYDFVQVWELLGTGVDDVDDLPVERFPSLEHPENRERLRTFLQAYDGGVINWAALGPLLRVAHAPDAYVPPKNGHGTHVAGILGADWRADDEEAGLEAPRDDLKGICPEIELYDLRVLGDDGIGNEFAIMSAMQFVRALNNEKDFVAIHGVNLSLSIPHDVANYACGRTPVCEEAERLVGNGIVVVAAAGNSGRARYLTPSNQIDDGFRTVSITDPGNADGVITVGATHRRDAHTYGVSYFSSRGPTGDGRLKPDLVAPGEKIRSTVPNNRDERLDGTSMAAPHVSGAAALIMARHFELIGQPRRIKETLCSTATDLGRERYFQGAGLLDVLRALSAI